MIFTQQATMKKYKSTLYMVMSFYSFCMLIRFLYYLRLEENVSVGEKNYRSLFEKGYLKLLFDLSKLRNCPGDLTHLSGPISVRLNRNPHLLRKTERENHFVRKGGYYKPPWCKPLIKVAIVIPYRNRATHLLYFLQYMHPALQRQELEYRIYIINQVGDKFNRAKLFNVGYMETLVDLNYDCYIFHDVDLILEHNHLLYGCSPENPRHLSVAIDKHDYQLLYPELFGGVTSFSSNTFKKLNGYSNSYWGWGGEDDDMYNRINKTGLKIERESTSIARYRMIPHDSDPWNEPNPRRHKLLNSSIERMHEDGLSNLQYIIISRIEKKLYTNVTVNLMAPNIRYKIDDYNETTAGLNLNQSEPLGQDSGKSNTGDQVERILLKGAA
ncbi:beta-1,4-galactosyltransferase 2-like [Clavelina lepadiformis]|uniref:Beta-1,4-galactosyltransferase n=1 Tax=Clavelina lepadiformis TaxID=159417 RepID=A0ABP0F7M8_CLALP